MERICAQPLRRRSLSKTRRVGDTLENNSKPHSTAIGAGAAGKTSMLGRFP